MQQELFPLPAGAKATHMIIVCDTYDHEDYSVYVHEGESVDFVKRQYDGVNMQRIHEIVPFDSPLACPCYKHPALPPGPPAGETQRKAPRPPRDREVS